MYNSSKAEKAAIYAIRVFILTVAGQLLATTQPYSRQIIVSAIVAGLVAVLNLTAPSK
jgi:hypothetical protein